MNIPEGNQPLDLSFEYGVTDQERAMLSLSPNHPQFTTPEEAQRQLEEWGYSSSDWERIVRDEIGSHSLRTFAITALSDSPRLRHIVFDNLKAIDTIRYGNENMPFRHAFDNPEMQIPALKRMIEESQ